MLRAAPLVCFVVVVVLSVAFSEVSVVGDVLSLVAIVVGVVCGVVALAKRGPHAAPIIGLVLHGFLVVLFVAGFIVGLTGPPPAEWPSTLPATPTLGPVLLTHEAVFKGEGKLGGASAFLAKHGTQTVVVTARHLLGEGWGIEPPIPANEVASHVETWRVHRRQPPDISTNVGALVASLDKDGVDVIAFAANDVDAGAAVVNVRDHAADVGEVVFLVGCPTPSRAARRTSTRCW